MIKNKIIHHITDTIDKINQFIEANFHKMDFVSINRSERAMGGKATHNLYYQVKDDSERL